MTEGSKHIDEKWKETAEKEKDRLAKSGEFVPPEATFTFFISTLALQAGVALGTMANPATNKKEEDLAQAQFLIDTIGMLKEKTKGNLQKDESELLETVLYELRMHFIEKTQKGKIEKA
jgi:hypothetical protein